MFPYSDKILSLPFIVRVNGVQVNGKRATDGVPRRQGTRTNGGKGGKARDSQFTRASASLRKRPCERWSIRIGSLHRTTRNRFRHRIPPFQQVGCFQIAVPFSHRSDSLTFLARLAIPTTLYFFVRYVPFSPPISRSK